MSRHTPVEQHRVPGFPDTLVIYKIPASRHWQMRAFVVGRGLIRRSTQTTVRSTALAVAKEFYENILLERRSGKVTSQASFDHSAKILQGRQAAKIARGERRDGSRSVKNEDQRKLDKDILPALGSHHVGKITSGMVEDYINDLSSDRSLTPSTLKKHTVLIHKVLKEAVKDGTLSAVPLMPTISREDKPRPWFRDDEYRKVLKTCREMAKEGHLGRDYSTRNRYHQQNMDYAEVYDFIVFMVHTFLRPSEWKELQHRHIRVEDEGGNNPHLVITVPNAKTNWRDSVSMPVAVEVYRRMQKRHGKPEDFLFFNAIKDRDYAQRRMGEMFKEVIAKAKLEQDAYGQEHSTYSLRHTALSFRLLKGDAIAMNVLAANARTSVDMLERFYVSHLKPEMMVEQLQAMRPASVKNLQGDQGRHRASR
jgi:integrase